MNNKKTGLLALAFGFIFIKIIPFISAYSFLSVTGGPEDVVYAVQNFLGPIFGALIGVNQFDQYFFARVLLLILVYVLCTISLQNVDVFKERSGAIFIISAVVAILGARYIGGLDLIETLLLPYGAVMISMITVLPFLVYFFFVHKTMASGAARRTAWIFFAAIYLGLWWTRGADAQLTEFRWVYNLALAGVVASVIFDSKIHEYFGIAEMKEARRNQVKMQLSDIEAKLNQYSAITNPSQTVRDTIRKLEIRQRELVGKL